MLPLVLASASPRRRELLEGLGVTFVVEPADIDETLNVDERPRDYVQRMAREKATVVLQRQSTADAVVLASDTSVVLGSRVLGKPLDREDARGMLLDLSGRQHDVLSAVCLSTAVREVCELVVTTVEFAPLSETAVERYLDTDEPWDKAGSYGIQGLAGAFVTRIDGSYSNVVGLPLAQTRALLMQFGVATALDAPAAAAQ